MKAIIRIWQQPTFTIECHELSVHDGARVNIDGELCRTLIVITDTEVFHPVVDIEVM